MRLREAVASALHLVVVLSYFSLGAFAMILPSRADWRLLGMSWLDLQPEIFYWGGAAFGAVGVFFLLAFFGVGRGRFLQLAMKSHQTTVDAKLIEKAIEECFKIHFPHHLRGVDVAVAAKKRLEVAIDIAPLAGELQEELFNEVEKRSVRFFENALDIAGHLLFPLETKPT